MNMNQRPLFLSVIATALISPLLFTACQQTAEERMLAELVDKDARFDAQKLYTSYLSSRDSYLCQLRTAADKAAAMRVKLSTHYGEKTEYILVSKKEMEVVREVLASMEPTPPRDFNTWLKERYDSEFSPQPAALSYGMCLEFLTADGEVSIRYYDPDSEIGDRTKAEYYRTAHSRPDYMLPADLLARWNALTFLNQASQRLKEIVWKDNAEHAKAVQADWNAGTPGSE